MATTRLPKRSSTKMNTLVILILLLSIVSQSNSVSIDNRHHDNQQRGRDLGIGYGYGPDGYDDNVYGNNNGPSPTQGYPPTTSSSDGNNGSPPNAVPTTTPTTVEPSIAPVTVPPRWMLSDVPSFQPSTSSGGRVPPTVFRPPTTPTIINDNENNNGVAPNPSPSTTIDQSLPLVTNNPTVEGEIDVVSPTTQQQDSSPTMPSSTTGNGDNGPNGSLPSFPVPGTSPVSSDGSVSPPVPLPVSSPSIPAMEDGLVPSSQSGGPSSDNMTPSGGNDGASQPDAFPVPVPTANDQPFPTQGSGSSGNDGTGTGTGGSVPSNPFPVSSPTSNVGTPSTPDNSNPMPFPALPPSVNEGMMPSPTTTSSPPITESVGVLIPTPVATPTTNDGSVMGPVSVPVPTMNEGFFPPQDDSTTESDGGANGDNPVTSPVSMPASLPTPTTNDGMIPSPTTSSIPMPTTSGNEDGSPTTTQDGNMPSSPTDQNGQMPPSPTESNNMPAELPITSDSENDGTVGTPTADQISPSMPTPSSPNSSGNGSNDTTNDGVSSPTSPEDEADSLTAVFCPGVDESKSLFVRWVYSVEYAPNTTDVEKEESRVEMELKLASEVLICPAEVGIDSSIGRGGRFRSRNLQTSGAIDGVVGIDYKPDDSVNTTASCPFDGASPDDCTVYNGVMTAFLEQDANGQIAREKLLISINDVMSSDEFPQIPSIVRVAYLEPILNETSVVPEANDEPLFENEPVETSTSLVFAFAAIGLFVIIATTLVIYRFRGRRNENGEGELTVAAGSGFTMDGSQAREEDEAEQSVSTGSYLMSMPSSYDTYDQEGMSAIPEGDSESESRESQTSVILSEGGFTTDGDSVQDDAFNPNTLTDPVLGVQNMDDEDTMATDREFLFETDIPDAEIDFILKSDNPPTDPPVLDSV